MTIQAVSPKELLRMAVGDLMAERTRDAREKTDFVLQNGIGSELCEALILSIFVFLAEGRPSAAKNISTYLGMTWNQSFLDALMPPLAQALAATSFVKRWFKNGAILESAEWMGANWVGFASRLDSLHSDGQASMPLAFKRAGDRPLAVLGLTGGLGSQMFQYAAGLDWAKRSGAELRIDTRFYRDVQREDRRFWLHQFNTELVEASEEDLSRVDGRKHIQDLTRLDLEFLGGQGDVYLSGFWPSHVYFEGVSNLVSRHFTFRNPHIAQYAKATVGDLRKHGPVVAVHVRRGDNTLAYNRNSYSLHPPTYYRMAAKSFPPDCVFMVFSDTNLDLEWCREKLNLKQDAKVVFSEAHSFLFDLALMIECDHHILSVSSFGWWAAWLGSKTGQRVVVPPAEQGTGVLGAHYRQDERSPPEWQVLRLAV